MGSGTSINQYMLDNPSLWRADFKTFVSNRTCELSLHAQTWGPFPKKSHWPGNCSQMLVWGALPPLEQQLGGGAVVSTPCSWALGKCCSPLLGTGYQNQCPLSQQGYSWHNV